MSRRTLAGALAVPLLIVLWAAAALLPVPYVTYAPGITLDVLAEQGGKEIVQVSGHPSYRDDGELRMTTIYVTQPDAAVNIFEALQAWWSDEQAIYPYSSVYGEDETAEDSRRQSAVAMVSSQDAATAVALKELGYDVDPVVEVLDVAKGMPADGKLEVRDVIVEIDGAPVTSPEDVVEAVRRAREGDTVPFLIRRDGRTRTVAIQPRTVEGSLRVGVTPGPGFEFPFDVSVNVSKRIGGPSAGLMFSLAIYDTLTPGSLTGGRVVAGTGTIDEQGNVGPVGGIQQKVVAASESGAGIFLVPAANCADALGAPNDDLRLVRATTMHQAMRSIEAWVANPDADLPSCEESR